MNLKKARSILERSAKGAISYIDNKGYRWYVDYFLPAIRKMESQHRTTCRDRYLISEAYYINGDIHDFNDAPQAAIRSYRRCLELDPKAGGAWREMGGMYGCLGHSKEALKC
ncbi:MAG: hypothetical protein Q8O90_02410, partial [Elusimicrobiota bacterium]|nr:hypothetical protein [Elusimicrobiota bacterium]